MHKSMMGCGVKEKKEEEFDRYSWQKHPLLPESQWPFPASRLLKLDGEQPLEEWKNWVREAALYGNSSDYTGYGLEEILSRLKQV